MEQYKPFLVALNLTMRCNLACAHCYLDAGTRDSGDPNELRCDDVKRILRQIAQTNPACMVVMTGGEPLLRPDIYELCAFAADLGLMTVVGTNGTLLTRKNVKRLCQAGVHGVGISVDSLTPKFHDRFRGWQGALQHTMDGIAHCQEQGLSFQIHTSIHQANVGEVDHIIAWAHAQGAMVMNFFFLVCTGRGEKVTDITAQQYEQVLSHLLAVQDDYDGMLVRARCAPHFKRLAYQQNTDSPLTRAQGYEGGGCLAGRHYCRVTPSGEVTVCPYVEESVGSLQSTSFDKIWEQSRVFQQLRKPVLGGKCGRCEFAVLCGGCRARPYARNGDLFGEDRLCSYEPGGLPVIQALAATTDGALLWQQEATARLSKLPYFLQKMIRKKVEMAARERELDVVTLDLMDSLRQARFGNRMTRLDRPGKQANS